MDKTLRSPTYHIKMYHNSEDVATYKLSVAKHRTSLILSTLFTYESLYFIHWHYKIYILWLGLKVVKAYEYKLNISNLDLNHQ